MSTPVNLAGRVTAQPELKFSGSGQPVAKFTVVTSRRVKDKAGEWTDADTSFWDVVAFGQLAENVAESLEKGTAVLVSGRAAQRTWEAQDGSKRRSVEVIADDVAPSLRWASAKVSRAERRSQSGEFGGGSGSRGADPWAASSAGYSDSPPF